MAIRRKCYLYFYQNNLLEEPFSYRFNQAQPYFGCLVVTNLGQNPPLVHPLVR